MRQEHIFTSQDLDFIRQNLHLTDAQLGKHFNCSGALIEKTRRKHGIQKVGSEGWKDRNLTSHNQTSMMEAAKRHDEIYQHYLSNPGIKTKELAKLYNLSQVHIGAILRKYRGRVIRERKEREEGPAVVRKGKFTWEYFRTTDIMFYTDGRQIA